MTTSGNQPYVNRQASDFRYFDLGRHWNSKLRAIFESDVVQAQLFQDFTKFQKSRARRFNPNYIDQGLSGIGTFSYLPTDKPRRCDFSEWRSLRIGRPYSFDDYVCYGACHWIVNSLLITARIAYPNKPWIIVCGDHHSTVWDQDVTFFDMNYYALKVSSEDCALSTVLDPESVFLYEGELRELA